MVTREPDVEAEMKRGNMREKWGLNLLYRINEGRLELCVKKGEIFSKIRLHQEIKVSQCMAGLSGTEPYRA